MAANRKKTLKRWNSSSDEIIQLDWKEWIDFFSFLNQLITKLLAKIDQPEVKVVPKRIAHIPPMFLTMKDYIAGFFTCSSEFSSETTPGGTI